MQFAFIFQTVSTRLGANHLPDKVWAEKFIFLSLAIQQAAKRGSKYPPLFTDTEVRF